MSAPFGPSGPRRDDGFRATRLPPDDGGFRRDDGGFRRDDGGGFRRDDGYRRDDERREEPNSVKARLRARARKKARRQKKKGFVRRKVCRFCADSTIEIDYKDPKALRLFVTETGKMIPATDLRELRAPPATARDRDQARPAPGPAPAGGQEL